MVHIFDVRIDNYTRHDVQKAIRHFLRGTEAQHITTINAEFLLEAQKNKEFKSALCRAQLNVADSISMYLAFWRQGQSLKGRYPGIDLMTDLLSLAEKNGYRVFLLARLSGLSTWQKTADAMKKQFPQLEIDGVDCDDLHGDLLQTVRAIDQSHAQIVLCNFGAPQQEIFLQRIKDAIIPSVRILMGVGGSFDFFTGKQRRAPRWMRAIGMEWLYRLVRQPQRLPRIVRAVIIFPLKLLFTKQRS